MKGDLKNFILLVILVVFIFVFKDTLTRGWFNLYDTYFPCKRPITYTLGVFDEEFGISKEDFLTEVKSAEEMWEESVGRDLFSYSREAKNNILTINLLYDYRQEATEKIKDLDQEVSATRASYDALRAQYDELQRSYSQNKAFYLNKISAFNKRQNEYQKEVEYWNKRGGAPKGTYEELSREGEALKKEYEAIKSLESNLDKKVSEINSLVPVINNLARALNINVEALNTVGEERGEEFTQGEYKNTYGVEEI